MLAVLEQIARDFDYYKNIVIGMTGGEPLLRSDIIEVLRGAQELGFKNFGIQTNGAILAKNPDLIPELVDAGVRAIGTDIDGIESTHDKFRGGIWIF